MSRSSRNATSLAWFAVVVAGAVILLVVLGLDLVPRLNAGQDVLDGARPAFTEERVVGDRVGITMVDSIVNLADPIVDSEGGAAGEVVPLVQLVGSVTGLSDADVLAAIEADFPQTYHLLLSLPLDEVSAEVPDLLTFVADNSALADSAAVLGAIAENTPNLAQAIVNLMVVTDNWRDVDGTEGVTRFDGTTPVDSVPEIRDFFAGDVITAVETVADDFNDLDGPWPKVSLIPWILVVIGAVVVALGLAMIVLTQMGMTTKASETVGWSVVVGVGVVVSVSVLAIGLFPRLNSGQDVLDGLRPAFVEERVAGMEVGVGIVDNVTNLADPIVDTEGGAAGEVGPLVDLVATATGLAPAEVLGVIETDFPHTYHLLLALPLDGVSAEIPGLLGFVAANSELSDADAVLGAIAENTPHLAQAIVNLMVVTDGWRAVPGTDDLTRFDGSPARSVPEIRDYFAGDVVPAVRAVANDYRTLDTTAPPVDVFPPLLLLVGILVIAYGAGMLAVTRVTAPVYQAKVAGAAPPTPDDLDDIDSEPAELVDATSSR